MVTTDGANLLPPASVLGMGAVTALGRDLDAVARRLEQSYSAPGGIARVSDDLSDTAINGQMRRADRFAKMAAIAAVDAWNAAGMKESSVAGEHIGLILSSGFGPHGRGFRFLDGILDNGDGAASPTDFSHSVHGAASAYISRLLDIRGPSLPLTDFEMGFEQAVQLAQAWLNDGTCDRVLIGAAEELGEVMLHCAATMLREWPGIVPGEGAVFFMLAPTAVPGAATVNAAADPVKADLLIVEDPPLPSSVAHRSSILAPETVTFASYFGHSASGAAFDMLGGLLAMRAGRTLGRVIHRDAQLATPTRRIDIAATSRTSSDARTATLLMTKVS
ncbi:MAG TPA: beta-ketoacyl synthase N-terminal-like domain-containing protein [Tepidisphaeraceae bacterium]|jgi:3-oxoacyl-(acyl-carrier-protein) synthase|nr:beta-ketoacyl synthase N-terminal-like domain-containing protein [Tepidisphaeraceae bacterium]